MENIQLSEVEKAYIAGFIDGEGFIAISKSNAGRKNFRVQIGFSNTNLEVMQWIHQKFNLKSKITVYDTIPSKNQKIRFLINIQRKSKVKEILENISPYLIVKRERAELAIEFLQINRCKQGIRNYILSEKEIEIHDTVVRLNKKGVD